MPKLHVIYVRGLGDHKPNGQRLAVRLWRIYGVMPHLFRKRWNGPEPFESKLARLLSLIDHLYSQSGQPVGLVGASAGASAALNAYVLRREKVVGVVCISGKLHRPETIHSRIMEHNPAFHESMQQLKSTLAKLTVKDRVRIRSVYSDGDTIVPMRDSKLEHAENELVGHHNHGVTIAGQITFGTRRNLSFLRQLSSRAPDQ